MLEAAGEPTKGRSRRRKSGEVPTGYRVAEVYFERRASRSIVGNIYKGKVDNVLPGLEAAFVDIGLDKNGFLHADDIVMPGVEVARRGRSGKGQRISELLKPGQEIVVQVMKSTLSRRVDLPSGGYLIIDYAEAMTIIDINSGSFTGRGKGARLEDTISKTNLEAAEEVVRQLRLRDIGGIIVIDFIDMARARKRDAVLKTLRKALDEDRTKTYVMEISKLGLVEMTRQNVTDGVREILTKECPTCDGEGVVLSEETVAIEVERKLRDLVAERSEPEAFLVQVHPQVSAQLITGPGAP